MTDDDLKFIKTISVGETIYVFGEETTEVHPPLDSIPNHPFKRLSTKDSYDHVWEGDYDESVKRKDK